MRSSPAILIVAFLLLSVLADTGSTTFGVVTGVVTDFTAERSIAVAPDQVHRGLFLGALPVGVGYEDRDEKQIDSSAMTNGVRVTVWYRRARGDRTRMVEKVRLLTDAPLR